MKQHVALIFSMLLLSIVGCRENSPEPSERDILIEALINNEWIIDPSATHVSNVVGAPNTQTFTIKFYENETGFDFVLGGDVADYLSRGSFEIAEAGGVSNMEVVTTGNHIRAYVTSLTITFDRVTLVVDLADDRIDCNPSTIPEYGTSTWKMVFTNTNAE